MLAEDKLLGHLRAESIDDHVLAELVSEVVGPRDRFLSSTVLANLLATALLALAMYDKASVWVLGGWLALQLSFQGLRIFVPRLIWQHPPVDHEELRATFGKLNALSACSGVVWGVAGVLFFFPDSALHQSLLAVLLCGLAAGSVPANAMLRYGLLGSAAALLLFFIARLLWEGDIGHVLMAAMIAVYLVFVLRWGKHLNDLLVEAIRRRFENADLIEKLRQQTEAALLAKQHAEDANAAKSKFLAAASHDLRQPMHALRLLCGALLSENRVEEMHALTGHISRSVEALEMLFNSLLDVSKLDAGVVRPAISDFSVKCLFARLQDDFAPIAAEKRLSLHVRPSAAVLRTDAQLLEQVLRNLVTNAIRYTEKGRVVIGCRRRRGQWRIYVGDTGIGIPLPEQAKVFDEFHQVGNVERDRTKGLGLGLAIVRRLAGLLQLPIALHSRPGSGTLFVVDVPVGDSSGIVPEGSSVFPNLSFAGLRVVVIEDEGDIRLAMKALLQRWECDVLAVESLEGALEALVERGEGWVPQFAIADLRLRDGASGIGALRLLQARQSSRLPALIVTGDTSPERLRDAMASGFHLLHKPVAPARLRSIMRLGLEQPEAVGQG